MPMVHVRRLYIALACCSVLTACGRQNNTIAPTLPSLTPTPIPTPAPVTLVPPKSLLRGLIDMQDISWHNVDNATPPPFDIANVDNFPGLFGGVVVNAAWNEMQPTAGGAVDFSYVDAAINAVQNYNSANPSAPIGIKLRIYGGSNAPTWAKNLPGGPITIYRNPAGCNGKTDTCPLTVGPFWTQAYIADWRAFQVAVANKYDTEPLIEAVAVTSCASQTDEPFVPTSGPVGKANLGAAGYSDTVEQACLTGAIDDYSAWKNTPVDFTFNIYSKFTGGLDPSFTQSVITLCRQKRGSMCITDNHALSAPIGTATPDPEYAMIQSAGPPINFQTQSPAGMQCLWTQTIGQGIAYGARAIEVWPETKFDGFDSLTMQDVQQLRDLFYASPPPAAPTPDPNASPCPAFN